jgi:DNA-directed RNA polymerase specialized sigma24 family protein
MNAGQIRAALRNLHALQALAEREGTFELHGPDGEAVHLADLDFAVSEEGPLPPRTREAVVLSLVEDLPYEEVAARMGITKGSVTQRVNKGLKELERLWA